MIPRIVSQGYAEMQAARATKRSSSKPKSRLRLKKPAVRRSSCSGCDAAEEQIDVADDKVARRARSRTQSPGRTHSARDETPVRCHHFSYGTRLAKLSSGVRPLATQLLATQPLATQSHSHWEHSHWEHSP